MNNFSMFQQQSLRKDDQQSELDLAKNDMEIS